jgi:glycine betaine/proline transport system substrate-binding protein
MFKNSRKMTIILSGLLLFCFMLAPLGSAMAQKTINIGWTAWSDAEAITKIAKQLLEEEMGYDVNLTMADIGIQYQGISKGDLDIMLMSWLPVTHQNYWKKYAGEVVNLGPLYTRAKLGWVVPEYIPEDLVSSIEDLKKPEVKEKLNKITGIDPGAGLMQASEKAMEEYGLTDAGYNLVSASGAGMTAALARAVRRDEWIVVTGWSPHWKFAKWDLRYIDDPKGVLGGRERIHALARKGFYQDVPYEVFEFFTRMFIPLSELEAVMLEATESDYETAVDNYIKNHPKRVNYWVTGKFE